VTLNKKPLCTLENELLKDWTTSEKETILAP